MDTSAKAYTVLASFLALPLLVGCSGPAMQRDLAYNSALYGGTGYRARAVTGLKVCLLPLVDARAPLEAYSENKFPVIYTQDFSWDRPVLRMLHDVMLNELRDARIFSEIVSEPKEADWVLVPRLEAFYGAVEQRISGRLARGLTKIHLEVQGPRQRDGQRGILRAKDFSAPISSQLGFILPSPIIMASSSLARAMASILADLEAGASYARGQDREASSKKTPAPVEQTWPQARKRD